MKRRVIKQGHNTFTITLPIKWANKVELKPGSELDVSEQGTSLVIGTSNVSGKSTMAEIDITGLPNPLLWRLVSTAYRSGYDEIKINFEGIENDKERLAEFSYDVTDWFYRGELPRERVQRLSPIEAIQALVNRFVGVEIIEQKQNYVIIKQFGEISYKEFDNALRRIFRVLTFMGPDILSAIKADDRTTLKSMHMIDTNIDRFEDYCLRVLNTKGYADYKKTSTIYTTIFLLEQLGDEYKRIAKHVVEDKVKYGPKSLKFFDEVNQQFEAYNDLFYNFNLAKVLKVFEKEEYFASTSKKLSKKATLDEVELYHHLKKITRLIISLVELAIDLRADTAFESNGKKKK